MDGVREGETFEGVGDPAEQKTILEPPDGVDGEGRGMEDDGSTGGIDPGADRGSDDAGAAV